jgi:hypothetical protein
MRLLITEYREVEKELKQKHANGVRMQTSRLKYYRQIMDTETEYSSSEKACVRVCLDTCAHTHTCVRA